MSDFALYSSLNFCKDNAFFRYRKTNEKTLIKKVALGCKFASRAMRFKEDFA